MATPSYTQQYPYYNPYEEIDPETGLPYGQGPSQQVVSTRGAVDAVTRERDPRAASAQDREFAYSRGQELDNDFSGDANRANFERDAAQGRLKEAYDPLIGGQGGLGQSDLQNVTRESELNNLGMTPDEMADSYLSMDERQAIQGNTTNRSRYFNPNRENDLFNEGAQRQRGATDSYSDSLNNAFDPNALRPVSGFADALAGGVNDYRSSMDSALDPNALTVSDEFLKGYQYTPEQQQNAVTAAANVVGTRDKAAIGELERRSRAAGTNPLGVAAQRERMERESSANAADAATAARVGVNAEAARRMQVGEGMRIGAGQQFAGMKMDAAGNVLDAGYRAGTTAENTRLGSERDIADRRMQAADRTGQARIAQEADLGQRRLALQQNQTTVGNAAERDADDTETGRARMLAENRLGNDRYVQEQRYGRGVGASDRLSDRYRYATDAKRSDAQEGRGYYREAANQANSNYNSTADRRASIYGTQAGAGQGATRTQAQIEEADKNRPKWYDKLIGGLSGAAGAYYGAKGGFAKGGVITEPTYALVGESGPEMIVPLDAENPEVVPSMAVRPGQPQPFQTAPSKFKPAYSQQYRYGS